MKRYRNIVQAQAKRELDDRYNQTIQETFSFTGSLVKRLGLHATLEGHSGCVNCLEWSSNGEILASGSDDVHVNLWDPFRRKLLHSFPTGHTGNIFSVKFVPNMGNHHVISGAADSYVHVHDISIGRDTIRVCSCHTGRVKRIVTDPTTPHLFWSGAEDGLIVEHDLRSSHTCASENKKDRTVLIDLKGYFGPKAEVKCLALNPLRPHYMVVGANDPYVRLYDRRLIKPNDSSTGALQFFVPGHLPSKLTEFKKKYRALASTYITYSPNGDELLVNLGGEQVYLYPMNPDIQKKGDQFSFLQFLIPEEKLIEPEDVEESNYGKKEKHSDEQGYKQKVLPSHVQAIKDRANLEFKNRNYAGAIRLYNEALRIYPNSSVLLGNRSAALLKRSWDGDIYQALKDCRMALAIDPDHDKAYLRMARCLFLLKQYDDAASCHNQFKMKFPKISEGEASQNLGTDIQKVMEKLPVPTPLSEWSFKVQPSGGIQLQRDNPEGNSEINSSESSRDSRDSSSPSNTVKPPRFFETEIKFRKEAVDFTERFCGHCNTTTDIKEANFFGNFILAGSDDGRYFIWDRETTNIVRIIKGDESIVNCLQPHPSTSMLATSGIDPTVKIWTPQPVKDLEDEIGSGDNEDFNSFAHANQKRMNTNPFEMILMNMGYSMAEGQEEEDSEDETTPNFGCSPS